VQTAISVTRTKTPPSTSPAANNTTTRSNAAESGADPNVACQQGHKDTAETLLEHGADSEQASKDGRTALSFVRALAEDGKKPWAAGILLVLETQLEQVCILPACPHTYTHARTHARAYTHIHIHTYTHTHTHTHTHTEAAAAAVREARVLEERQEQA
jgi:hypothetical protein